MKADIILFIVQFCPAKVEDPLLEATKYLKLLQKNSPDSLETHLLSFELYMRKHKILLAFQVLIYSIMSLDFLFNNAVFLDI